MNETKRFPLRVVLSIATSRLLTKPRGGSDNGIGDVYEILGWMTNDSPMTHQIPRFCDECRPWLLRWFPELALPAGETPLALLDQLVQCGGNLASIGIEKWLESCVEVYGCKAEYDVPRIPADDHTATHPYNELVQMLGTDEGIIVVESPAANSQQDGSS